MINQTPCVTIVLTTFNRLELLKETLNSILKQSYTDFELLVVDNMSTDGTSDYFSSAIDSRIRYFRNPNNGIIAVNRNFGINEAKGKYIAFCDDDDLWMVDKLTLQVDFLESNNNIVLCYSNAESFAEGKVVDARMVRRVVKRNFFKNLLQGSFIPNSSVMIRREIFEKVGLLTENPSLREDYEMWLRVGKHFEIQGIDSSLIKYRLHNSNVAGNRAKETLRAIRTVRSVVRLLDIPAYQLLPNLGIQFLKYFCYRIIRK